MNMMNPKMEPQDYDESEDGLDMMADDSVSHDPLVQQLLGGADQKGMAGKKVLHIHENVYEN